MDLTVSEHLDLFICKCALHPVRVVSKVFVCYRVIFLDARSLMLTREVLALEGLEIFLHKQKSLEVIPRKVV